MSRQSFSIRNLLKRAVPFLRGYPPLDHEHIEHILVMGTGSVPHIKMTLQDVHARFPAARVALVVWHTNRPLFRGNAELDETIAYEGPHQALALRRRVARMHCDLKVVLFTGEGQMVLKLLAFILPARRMLVYTEGGGSFSWDFDHRLAIWNHIKWRLRAGQPSFALLGHLGRALLYPLLSFFGVILLLVWHVGLWVKRRTYKRRAL